MLRRERSAENTAYAGHVYKGDIGGEQSQCACEGLWQNAETVRAARKAAFGLCAIDDRDSSPPLFSMMYRLCERGSKKVRFTIVEGLQRSFCYDSFPIYTLFSYLTDL
jgi:hypothetical protein